MRGLSQAPFSTKFSQKGVAPDAEMDFQARPSRPETGEVSSPFDMSSQTAFMSNESANARQAKERLLLTERLVGD